MRARPPRRGVAIVSWSMCLQTRVGIVTSNDAQNLDAMPDMFVVRRRLRVALMPGRGSGSRRMSGRMAVLIVPAGIGKSAKGSCLTSGSVR